MPDAKTTDPRTEQGRQAMEQRGQRSAALTHVERETYFNPFTLMRRLSDEMDRAFATSFGLPSGTLTGLEQGAEWTPAVEVAERDNNLVVTAELPGLSKDDVKVEVTNDGLLIQGERKREHEEKRRGYYRSERSYGQFYRMVPLPEGIDPDKAKAQFKDGVLQVEIPLPASAQAKRKEIPIKT
jgi:HSP20 family protein